MFLNLGNRNQATDQFTEGLKLARESNNQSQIIEQLINLGVVYTQATDFPRALVQISEAININNNLRDQKYEGALYANRGTIYLNLGRYSLALTDLNRAMSIQVNKSDQFAVADDLINLGYVYEALGDKENALASFEKAEVILDSHKNSTDYEQNLLALADFYSAADQLDRSLEYYSKVVTNFTANFNEAWDMYRREHPNSEEGTGLQDKSFQALYKAILLNDYPALQSAKLGIAEIYLKQNRIADAAKYFQELGDIIGQGRCELLAGNYRQALLLFEQGVQTASRKSDLDNTINGYIGIGGANEHLKLFDDAYSAYLKASRLIEQQRDLLPSNRRRDFFNISWRGISRALCYEGLVRVSLKLRQPEKAFFWSEHSKARTLLDSLATNESKVDQLVPTDLKNQLSQSAQQLAAVESRLATALVPGNNANHKLLEAERDRADHVRANLIQQLRTKYPEYAMAHYPEPLMPYQLKLHKDELLVSYVVTESMTVVFVVRNGFIIKSVEIPISRNELAKKVELYRRVFINVGQTGNITGLKDLNITLGNELYNLLLKDVIDVMTSAEKIIVIPDAILSLLPFEALIEYMEPSGPTWQSTSRGPVPTGLRYIGSRLVFTYWQSASSLTVLRNRESRPRSDRLLIVADPIFSKNDPRAQQGQLRNSPSVQPISDQLDTVSSFESTMRIRGAAAKHGGWASFPRLASTAEFVIKMKEIYGDRVTALEGIDASESHFRQMPLDEYGSGVIFATHGLLDERTPYFQEPVLVLSNPAVTGEPQSRTGGFLTMTEIMSLKIPTELIATFACTTGLGSSVKGEGVMNLGRAFQYAGARTVIVTLWGTEDQSANILGESLFADMKSGKAKDVALINARRLLMEQGFGHPFYWAPFILVGEREMLQ
jgi:CHAT domain-containing protein/Tfp pilus assembly protein PilF